ncbi:MAG TPA: hypothetical protein VF520_15580 [Thermoleophilaceae bacterium]|jgi:hypothetical protein
MFGGGVSRCARALAVAAIVAGASAAPAAAAGPESGSPEFVQRDAQNMSDADGRVFGPGGQLDNPAYLPALLAGGVPQGLGQLVEQTSAPTRPSITPGIYFPGWNRGNPLRDGWAGTRGLRQRVAWTNRYGALIRGDVYAPLPGARDPYTGARLKPPYPGAVFTTGSIQGSERMYEWLAEDLAERGYLVLTYDVQGQGTSETAPHENEEVNALPFCNPFAPPREDEMLGCPGVPSQQAANFVFGTQDALDFFLSTPRSRYPNPRSSDVQANAFNPLWRLFDRSRDRRSVTPGRTTRVAILGHSLGASAVSRVQGIDRRVEAVVALDKLSGAEPNRPVVPALAVQSEYGFTVNPYWANNGSSLQPRPGSPSEGPDPRRELATGFEAWRKAGVDVMLVVPRASTHMEYTDIPLAMPASRYGQALTSAYIQAFLAKYVKHEGDPVRSRRRPRRRTDPLLAARLRYLEPVAVGRWEPIELERSERLSFYYCSGWAMRKPGSRRTIVDTDVGGVGGC